MQVRIGFVAVWIATTAAGMAISWAGVGDALRGTALPTQDLAAEVPVHQGRPPASEPTESTEPPEPAPKVAVASATAQAPTRKPSPAAKPPEAGPSASPTTEDASAPVGDVRTYVVKSGRVVLSLSASSARLVSATPDSGFHAKVWRQDGWLRVDLTDGVKGSAVFAKWNGHPPLVETYEY